MISLTPKPQLPPNRTSFEDLRHYGEMLALLWRTDTYADSLVATQAAEIQVPVDLGFFGLAHAEGAPIGYFTYARVSDELQLSFLRGEVRRISTAEDWVSGDNVWIVSAVSPYDRAGMKMTRYIVENMPLDVRLARALRVYRGSGSNTADTKRRIVEWYRDPETDVVKVRTKSVDDLVAELTGKQS